MKGSAVTGSQSRRSLADFLWPAVLVAVCVAAAIFLFKPVVSLPALSPKDFNEGFHAYFALNAFRPEGLYPPRDGLIANGYTPLFFYLAGALGAAIGDHIIAGRLLALAGFLVTSVGVGLIVGRLTGCRPVASFAAVFFAAFMALNHPSYVAMNDPQWVAQAFVIAALYAFLSWGESVRGMVMVVLLVLAAGLSKQTVIALPLAITLYLLVYQRERLVIWLLGSVVALAVALVGLYGIYGRGFFVGVLLLDTDMEFSFARVLANVRRVAGTMSVLLIPAAVFLALEPRTPRKMLLLAYAAFAALVGFFLTGGAGVDWNHLYDLVIALTIIMGAAVVRLGERLEGLLPRQVGSAAAAALVSLPLFLAVPAKLAEAGTALADAQARQARVAKVVAALAAQEGSVLCETMALCYWAKKPHEVDILVLRRRLLSGAITDEEFRRMLDSGRFRMIQFHSGGTSGRSKRLPEKANDYIFKVFDNQPNAMGGSLLTWRGGGGER